MISAGSTVLTQKWVDVLHDDNIIPESDINVMCPYDTLSTTGYTIYGYSNNTYCDISVLARDKSTINRDRKIATFEHNFWVLDGTFELLDTNEKYKGFLSFNISNENCEFSGTTPYLYFDAPSSIKLNKKQTIKFAPSYNEVPSEITIFTQTSGTVRNNITFDILTELETENIGEVEYVHLFSNDIDDTATDIRTGIIFNKTSMPYRRARLVEYNNGYKFFANKYDMLALTHTRSADLKMAELPQNDMALTITDLEGIFDARNTAHPFYINFDNAHRFYVYYGYNFDDIGWHYVYIDFLCKRNLEIDRNSLETTFNLQSTLQLNTAKYSTSKINWDGSQSTPYNWKTFKGFLSAIKYFSGIPDIDTSDVNITGYLNSSYDDWQLMLAQSSTFDKTFPKTPANQLVQQIASILRCVVVRQPTGVLKFKPLDSPTTTEVDYVPIDNIMSYPSYEKESQIKYFYVSSPVTTNSQNEDKNTSVYAGSQQVATARPSRTKITVPNVSDTQEEETLTQNVVPIGWLSYSCWDWETNMWQSWVNNYHKWHIATRYTFEELLINPLWQVGDTLKLYTGDIKNYLGLIESIEVQYDGGFKGSVKICSILGE